MFLVPGCLEQAFFFFFVLLVPCETCRVHEEDTFDTMIAFLVLPFCCVFMALLFLVCPVMVGLGLASESVIYALVST